MNVKFEDHSKEVLDALHEAAQRAMEACGQTAEGYAKKLAPVGDTGNLRNSIAHKVVADKPKYEAIVGTDVEYGVYQELGTGVYAVNGDGRKTPWVYKDDNGNWHRTVGNKPQPFLKPAIADHMKTYQEIIEQELKG